MPGFFEKEGSSVIKARIVESETPMNVGIDPEGDAGYLLYGDALFRKHRKKGWAYVGSPVPALEAPVADTHAHLAMLSHPALSLARCAVVGVDFVCVMCDPAEGDECERTYRDLDIWRAEALRLLPEVFEATRRNVTAERELLEAQSHAAGKKHAGQAAEAAALLESAAVDERACNLCWGAEPAIPHMRIACGVHPHVASQWDADMEAALLERLADPRTAALGEVGLDYHYDLSPRDVQQNVFRRQVQLAHVTGLPLVLHVRDAHEDAFRILEEEGWPEAGTLLHCCSVGPDELARWVERGAHVAFGGAVTFQRSDDLRASSAMVPAERLLTETDAPYMAPVPFRGIECGPEFTIFTAERIAEVRGVAPGEARRALLQQMHDAGVAFLNREPTEWQRAHADMARDAR